MQYKKSFILIAIFFVNSLFSQVFKEVYENPNFDKQTQNHKKVAILPFTVILADKALPEGITTEELNAQQEDEGRSYQSSVFARFLKKSKNYTVSFQDISRTNTLLKKNEIAYSELDMYTKDEIAKILEVDSVISGQIHRDKPMSGGAAVALAVFTGFGGATNKAKLYLTIHDGSNGDLLWSFNHQAAGGLGSDVESVVKRLMKKVARNFPYKK